MRPGVSLAVLGYPWLSWGILGCPGVIRPTCTDVQASLSYKCDWYFSMYASLFVCHPSDQNLN